MSVLPPIPPNIADITAPPLLGSVWNWGLYGVLVVQTYVYSYNFPDDRISLKLLVYGVFLIETIQTAMSGADLYYRFASGFGNMNRLANPYISAFEVPLIGAVVSLVVQYFFSYRVWVLSNKKSWWICMIICVFSTFDAVAAFSWGVYAHIIDKFVSGWRLKFFALSWLIGNTVADTLISSLMLYYLTRRRSGGGDRFHNHALTRVVRLTIETNIMTTVNGVITLLMVSIFPDKIWYTCPAAILGKLYSNTLLVSLNNRISIRDVSHTRGGLLVSRPMARGHSGAVHLELENTSYTSQERSHSGEDGIIDISSFGLSPTTRELKKI